MVGHLHGVDVGQVERQQRLALGVGGEQQVEARRELTTATTARGFGSSGARAGRARRRREHADAQSPPASVSVERRRGRGRGATPRRAGLAQQRAEGGIGRAVAAVEQQVRPGSARSTSARPPWWSREAWVATTSASRSTPALRSRRATPRLGRPAVEEHGGAVGVLDQRGVALADVEEADGEAVGRAGAGERARPRRGARPRRRPRERAAATPRGRPRQRAARSSGARRERARARRAISAAGREQRA